MPDEDKNFGGSLVLDFKNWRRHVKTIYRYVRLPKYVFFPPILVINRAWFLHSSIELWVSFLKAFQTYAQDN